MKNHLPGNPYVRDAVEHSGHLNDWIEQEGMTDATMIASVIQAHTLATLALAFEQRSACLLEFHTLQTRDEGAVAVFRRRLGIDSIGEGQ